MCPRDEQPKLTPPAIFGVVIALLGVIFTLDNLGLADTGRVVRYWPVLPIGLGVIMLMHAGHTREWVFGERVDAGGALLLAGTRWAGLPFVPRLPAAAAGRVGVWLICATGSDRLRRRPAR